MKRFSINAPVILGLGLAMALLGLMGSSTILAGHAGQEYDLNLPAGHHGPTTPRHASDASRQAPNVVHVCLDGSCDYSSIQAAVDAVEDGGEVLVAAGTYAGVEGRPAPSGYSGPEIITQTVYISKSATIRGGYTPAFSEPPDPVSNPTTLDAQRQGRVIFITGTISLTLQGLRMTGGDAAGLGGHLIIDAYGDPYVYDAGGGVYIGSATVTFSNNLIFDNTAPYGGGLYLDKSAVTLGGNSVTSNTAQYRGGGLYLAESPATLGGNSVMSNTAGDSGGGVYLSESSATLSGNTIQANTAAGHGSGGGLLLYGGNAVLMSNTIADNSGHEGGGVSLGGGDVVLSGNTISGNTARYKGGGLLMYYGNATIRANTISHNAGEGCGGVDVSGGYGRQVTLSENTISDNTALSDGGGGCLSDGVTFTTNTVTGNTAQHGGGLSLCNAIVHDNTISHNTALDGGGGLYLPCGEDTLGGNIISGNAAYDGGGLFLYNVRSTAVLTGNTIVSNTAQNNGGGLYLDESLAVLGGNTISANTARYGGGLHMEASEYAANSGITDLTLTNNFIVGNRASVAGAGLYLSAAYVRMLHNTVAHNGPLLPGALTPGAAGSGIYVTHHTLDKPYYCTVLMTNTILAGHTVGITVTQGNTALLDTTLWGNGTDWGGTGTIVTGTRNTWDDPAFVDASGGNYHISPASAAIDRGIDAGVTTDIDGDPRPAAFGFDLGADERPGTALFLRKAARPLVLHPGWLVTYTITLTNTGISPATQTMLTDTLPLAQRPFAISSTRGSCAHDARWGGKMSCSLGTLAPGDRVHITLTAQVMSSLPAQLPWPMRNTVWVTATEASAVAYADTRLYACHVRLNDSPFEYHTVQAAVDASTHPTDVVKVAGACTGVNTYGGLRQQVYLSKTLTIRGGYTPAFAEPPDPATYPASLDALGQGRVLYIAGAGISVTLEGLRITGGDATGLGGHAGSGYDAGGGVYAAAAKLSFRDSQVSGSFAPYGGGLYLHQCSQTTFDRNTITANTTGYGGGLYLHQCSAAVFMSNTLSGNVANYFGAGDGGGLYLDESSATLISNTITGNTVQWGYGGGLRLDNSTAIIRANSVTANTAGFGGGVSLDQSPATLDRNTLSGNTARWGGGLHGSRSPATLDGNVFTANTADLGGGLFLAGAPALRGNSVIANTAYDQGGGLFLVGDATLDGDSVIANTARYGGGLYLWASDATLINTVVADNQASTSGSGLYIGISSPRLLHTTIARNGSAGLATGGADGSGVYVSNGAGYTSTVAMTNTILAGHSVGITVAAGSKAVLEATLWGAGAWANGADWGGDGTLVAATRNVWGNPAFADPAGKDYHLGPGSAALDAGVNAGVMIDIDGQPRPAGAAPDLGADEYIGVDLTHSRKTVSPSEAGLGDVLTYTIVLFNTGPISATDSVLFDPIPAGTTYVPASASATSGVITGTSELAGTIIFPGGIGWRGTITPYQAITLTFRVTIDENAPILNTAIVTDGLGVSTRLTAWANVHRVYLPLIYVHN